MKIVINKTKLLYFDALTNELNLGNFPETGKTIGMENDTLLRFFQNMINPIEYDDGVALLASINRCSNEEARDAIDYLLTEKILINFDEFEKISKDEFYGRELSYFYMLSNKNKKAKFENVRHKKIAILGVGGIGSVVAEMIVRAGFDNLLLVDNDVVESSNLIRQIGYLREDVNKSKLDSSFRHLLQINPKTDIKIANVFVDNNETLKTLLRDTDFVVCTFDKPFRVIRPMVNDVCVELKKPVLFSGFAEHVGMVGPFVVPGKTACLKCINKEHNEPINRLDMVPSYGPLCGIIGNFVTDEIINYFIKFKKTSLQNKTLMLNLYNDKLKVIKWNKNSDCPICGRCR